MNDILTFGRYLAQQWTGIVAYGQSPYFPWMIATILVAMLGWGIWQTVKAQERAASSVRQSEEDISRRIEDFSRKNYGPVLDQINENTNHLRLVIKKMGAHFVRINDLHQVERILREIERIESDFDAIIKANNDYDPTSIRHPFERWDNNIRDQIEHLYNVVAPYMGVNNDFRHISQIELDSFDPKSYEGVNAHLRRHFVWWKIMKKRIKSLESGPIEELRQSVQSIDRFMQNIDETDDSCRIEN
ncbi:hypothetical protein M1D80_11865 [Phyllobacteriaceae bacterium JZ32]